jgi:serine/threonine protein kinase
MHSCGIVHRDLKPENLLLTSPLLSHGDAHVLVKVVDFGLSTQWKSTDPLLNHACGTWAYGAPEVRAVGSQGYGSAADAWALGVIVYIVLAGFHPFDPTSTASQSVIMQAITKGMFDFDDPAWSLVSDDAKHFVTALLQTNPLLRLTAAGALEHPWMISSPTPGSIAPISAHIAEDILRYRKMMRGKLKASFVVAIASVRMSLKIAKLHKNIKSNIELGTLGEGESTGGGGASSGGGDVVACQ